jgi:hypothetical protein
MNSYGWSFLCAFIIGCIGGLASDSSYAAELCQPYQYTTAQPRTVEHAPAVRAPVHMPRPPVCPPSPTFGIGHSPAAHMDPSIPVRGKVAMPPRHDPNRLVPVVYRSQGPIEPVVTHTVGLVGALVAAPFRVSDMFLPVYHPCLSLPKQQGGPPPGCGGPVPGYVPQITCLPPQPQCGLPCPPPCPPPMKCAPSGPSISPLPRAACPPPCTPNIPASMVEDAEYPYLEPAGLLAGLWGLPSRVLQRGRLFGDMNRSPSPYPSMR